MSRNRNARASTSYTPSRSDALDEDSDLYATPSRLRQYREDSEDLDEGQDDWQEGDEFGYGYQLDEGEDEEDYDDAVDDDGDEMDGVFQTPSKRSKTNASLSRPSPANTPTNRRRGAKHDPTTPTPRKGRKTPNTKQRKPIGEAQAEWLEKALKGKGKGESEGFIRPTAADAYFVAAARPKRKRTEEMSGKVDGSDGEGEELLLGSRRGKTGLLGTTGRSGKKAKLAKPKREEVIDHLAKHIRSQYSEWERLLRNGNNLIHFGYGSKRLLLNEFADSRLAERGHVMVINGLYPGLTIKDLLIEIEEMFPDIRDMPVVEVGLTRAIDKLAYRIYAYFLPSIINTPFKVSAKPLYLVVHNIDAPGVRTERSLALLSLLASSPRIHLITSFDHVHTPILFSQRDNTSPKHNYTAWNGVIPPSRGFNWAWIESPTYAPYTLEMQYVQQTAILTGKSLPGMAGGQADQSEITEEGVLRILQSVPPMARRLFKLLATRQLGALPPDEDSAHSIGSATSAPVYAMDSDILQKLAKDRFIAREEERFNSQLGEYRDHGAIVEHNLDSEGRSGRWLWIPLNREVLTRVLSTMEDVEA